jgi:RNA polymerase sigma factor (sigma-70 family)
MMNGIDLLNEFRERRSEAAFSELVRLYTNLVLSVAIRRLGNQSLAQEVAQAVFIRLAKSAPQLGSDAELAAWLHRTAVHVSIDLWRSEARRRAREEQAAAMQLNLNEPSSEIAPALDEALNELSDADRQAILLRFFKDKPMRDLGTALGISEDAAKMRVSRAIERLRHQLGARGVTCTAAVLGAFLAERAVEAAPSEIATAIASFSYPLAEGAGTAAAGTTSSMASALVTKLVGGIVAVTLVGLTTWVVVHRQQGDNPTALASAAGRRSGTAGAPRLPSASRQNSSGSVATTEPDPVKLLQGVARARQRIGSGLMEFEVETFPSSPPQTNYLRMTALFEGTKRRFEQFGREYSYTYDPDPARAQEITAKADAFGSDREGAVRAGLLGEFESHHVLVDDGSSLMDYWETDGKPSGTIVSDRNKGSSSFVFDPRCLGLAPFLGPWDTLETSLRIDSTNRAELLGQEPVDGVSCWHLRVPFSQRLEFWLEAAQPTRVRKVQNGATVVLSKYDETARGNPIPKEVLTTESHNGTPAFGSRFVQVASQYNITPDPATFTLAGLGMKVGTSVIDSRIMRQIGYWTGTGLSEGLPPKKKPIADEQPNLEELLMILDTDPASPAALDAATWILLNTPDGPAVEKAAAVIRRDHVRSPELLSLCQQMERVRHSSAGELLQAVLKENPSPEIQAMACFTLATLRKDACQNGADKPLAVESEKLFERVINDFSQVGSTGRNLAQKAKPELSELRRLTIGKPAPDFEGTDLQGQPFKLSAQRGKVVMVVFWSASTVDGPEEHRQILSAFAGQPVVWVGINCDNDRARAIASIEKHHLTWPVIWDDQMGPISTDWNVHSWTTVFVLDRSGIIRSREARGPALAQALRTLLAE